MALGSMGIQVVNRYLQDNDSHTQGGPVHDVDSRKIGFMLVRDYLIAKGNEHLRFQKDEEGINEMYVLLNEAATRLKDGRQPTGDDINELALGTLAGYRTLAFHNHELPAEARSGVDARVGSSIRSLAEALKARHQNGSDAKRRTAYFQQISRLAENLAPLVAERIHLAPESLKAFIQTLVHRVEDDLTLVEGTSRGDLDPATKSRIHLAILLELERFRQQGVNQQAHDAAARIQFEANRTRTSIPDVHSLDSAGL